MSFSVLSSKRNHNPLKHDDRSSASGSIQDSVFSGGFMKRKNTLKVEPLGIKLQHEGDHYKSKRDYVAAADKYVQATKFDTADVALWNSLAACHLELHKYEEVIVDAWNAITLEPRNARAHFSVTEAYLILEDWASYFTAFEVALGIVKESPDPDHKKIHQDLVLRYSEAGKKYKSRRRPQQFLLPKTEAGLRELPWRLAKEASVNFKGKGPEPGTSTSAWVISEASDEFNKGYDLMRLPKDAPPSTRSLQAIALMSNGIVRDPRCFYMIDEDEFMEQFLAQAEYEVGMTGAWGLNIPVTMVKSQVVERLDTFGWDRVRPALAVTIRTCIINAQMSAGFNQYGQAACLLRRALALLDWGRETWPKVDRKVRGAVFDGSWVRNARVLYAEFLVLAYDQTKTEKTKPYDLGEILSVGQRILKDCHDKPMKAISSSGKPASPVYLLSYQYYPEGRARICQGYYFHELGRQKIMDGKDRSDANRDLRLSTNEYDGALKFIPQDDELYSICLLSALEAHFLAKTPLKETTAIITTLRSAWASCEPIWSGSPSFSATGGRERIERLFQFQDNALKAVAEKAGALGDRIVPGRWGDRVL